MMSKIATQVMSNQSSKGLWEVVQQILGVQNKVETNYLKRLFQQTRKGSLKMEEYLSTMKKYDGDLALAKNPVSNDDLISQTLSGLDEEYNPIVVVVQGK